MGPPRVSAQALSTDRIRTQAAATAVRAGAKAANTVVPHKSARSTGSAKNRSERRLAPNWTKSIRWRAICVRRLTRVHIPAIPILDRQRRQHASPIGAGINADPVRTFLDLIDDRVAVDHHEAM